jgi:hypothetical protein
MEPETPGLQIWILKIPCKVVQTYILVRVSLESQVKKFETSQQCWNGLDYP